MEPGEELVIDELERRLNLSWQGWHLDKEKLVLWHETLSASHGYAIDLLRCITSAELLGWIMELRPRHRRACAWVWSGPLTTFLSPD
jgi:hypothetical protein